MVAIFEAPPLQNRPSVSVTHRGIQYIATKTVKLHATLFLREQIDIRGGTQKILCKAFIFWLLGFRILLEWGAGKIPNAVRRTEKKKSAEKSNFELTWIEGQLNDVCIYPSLVDLGPRETKFGVKMICCLGSKRSAAGDQYGPAFKIFPCSTS